MPSGRTRNLTIYWVFGENAQATRHNRVLGIKSPTGRRGCLTYAATCSAVRGGPSYWCGLVSASGVEGRAGLVTLAMNLSTSLIALSIDRKSTRLNSSH